MRRWDIYVKYVEILRKIHKACKNAVCAANTLKLHAELLYWSNEPLEEYLRHPSYPNESVHKTLKERLFIDMINDYTEGQAWEKAFELSKILRGIYDSEYELEKLYKFLRKQADLCENIIKVERYECKFYLVGFYGRGLHLKIFITFLVHFTYFISFYFCSLKDFRGCFRTNGSYS
jgi:dedicator of cytokinesis protein 1